MQPVLFLSAGWMLVGTTELVSVIIIVVFSGCWSNDFYTLDVHELNSKPKAKKFIEECYICL